MLLVDTENFHFYHLRYLPLRLSNLFLYNTALTQSAVIRESLKRPDNFYLDYVSRYYSSRHSILRASCHWKQIPGEYQLLIYAANNDHD